MSAPAPTFGYVISPQQRLAWRLQELRPNEFSATLTMDVLGNVDSKRLGQALRRVIARHEILRTSFAFLPETTVPIQIISSDPAFDEEFRDFSAQSDPSASAVSWMTGPVTFDLSIPRPLVLRRSRLAKVRHCLQLILPVVCGDHRSLITIAEEVADAYGGLAADVEDPPQYADVAEVFNEFEQLTGGHDASRFWSNQYAAATGDGRLIGQSAGGVSSRRSIAWDIPFELSQEIVETARRLDVRPADLLLAAWRVLLWHLAEDDEPVIHVALEGRTHPDLARAIGPFERVLPLRLDVCAEDEFATFVHSVARQRRQAADWQDYGPPLDGDRAVASFRFEARELPRPLTRAGIRFEVTDLSGCTGPARLKLCCVLGDGRPRRFALTSEPTTRTDTDINRIQERFEMLLRDAVTNPTRHNGRLRHVGDRERRELVVEFNATARQVPCSETTLPDLFEAQAHLTPDTTAVICGEQRLTFAELDQRANQVAKLLHQREASNGAHVVLLLERSVDMLIGLLAASKVGATFVPLDPQAPPGRLEYQLRDVDPKVVLTHAMWQHRAAGFVPSICLDQLPHLEVQSASQRPPRRITQDDIAYVLYTSGSTGCPKGVLVPHRGLTNYLLWAVKAYDIASGRGVPVHSPLTFDLTLTALLTPLLAGRCVYLLPADASVETLAGVLCDSNDISLVKLTPAHLEGLSQYYRSDLHTPGARAFVVGGENLTSKALEPWRRYTALRIFNEYGPTEAVVGCVVHEARAHDFVSSSVPIGRPIANIHVFLLDAWFELVPMGGVGEIYIGGVGLARGYLHDAARTAERFVPNPFAGEHPDIPAGSRLYRTGDLARMAAEGVLEYVGRRDEQVKIRGHRVELGEVEAVLRQHPAIQDAVAMMRDDGNLGKRLVAYVVPHSQRASPVRRRLQMERENPALKGAWHELPDGRVVAHVNRAETEYLYHAIVEQRSYFKHGITLHDGACVFDVGANIGMYSLCLHELYTGLRFYAFEPIPRTFAALRRNVMLYGLEAELIPKGVAAHPGVVKFRSYRYLSLMSGRYTDLAEDADVVKIYEQNRARAVGESIAGIDGVVSQRLESEFIDCTMTTISEAMRTHRVENLDLLKLDIEKSEVDALDGIDEEDWPRIRQLVVEVHDSDGRLAHVKTRLETRGYLVTIEQDRLLASTNLHTVFAVRPTSIVPPSPQTHKEAKWRSVAALRADAIRSLREWLPEYMLPSALVLLDALPLTAHGKIDRGALPPPGDEGPKYHVAPRNDTEAALVSAWQAVLDTELGVTDNFYDLGGHSLLAIRVAARCSEALGRAVPVLLVLQHPTVAELASALDLESIHIPASVQSSGTTDAENSSTTPASIPQSTTILYEARPLLPLIVDGQLPTVDAAAVTYFPASLFGHSPVTRTIIERFCEGLPIVSSILETRLGRIAMLMIPLLDTDLFEDHSAVVGLTSEAVSIAGRIGARVVALAGLIPTTTNYGTDVERALGRRGPSLTTGHATTAAAVILNVKRALEFAGRTMREETLGILGLGSIGSASLLQLVATLPHPREVLLCDVPVKRPMLEHLRRHLLDEQGYRGIVRIAESKQRVPAEFYRSTVMVCATNVPDVLRVAEVASGTIIVDDSGPHCFDVAAARARLRERRDLLFTEGGALQSPDPVRRIVHFPPVAEAFLDRAAVARLSQCNASTIMGCSFSALLSARHPSLEPRLGLADQDLCSRHLAQLVAFGFSGAELHCDGQVLPKDEIVRFQALYGTPMRTSTANVDY